MMNGRGNHGKWHFRAMSLSTFRDEKQAERCYDSSMSAPCLRKPVRAKMAVLKVKVKDLTRPVFEEIVLCLGINSYVMAPV